ncbi:hypothetical protein [Moorena sp. SIO3I8]|uniref:hypothetical protein n=1 Tax=Moorena sp. SIO3I8 TaxID=2607833 RepID=UPI0025F5DED7|nr:hypothetical protein [Moorena sp. SIO3I8]
MPVPPIPKAGYWQDASSTDSQGRILASCPFYRFPITYSLLPTPYSLLPNGNQDWAISDQQEYP